MPISTGSVAPDFTLKASDMSEVTLSSHRGKQSVVLLFFPAAFSSICTAEMCDVSQGLTLKADDSTVVYGVSVDSAFSLDAWKKQSHIDTPLLSDYKREVTSAYGVVLPDLAGLGPSAARAAFVVDKEGVVRYAEQTPTPRDLPNFEAIRETLAGL